MEQTKKGLDELLQDPAMRQILAKLIKPSIGDRLIEAALENKVEELRELGKHLGDAAAGFAIAVGEIWERKDEFKPLVQPILDVAVGLNDHLASELVRLRDKHDISESTALAIVMSLPRLVRETKEKAKS